MARRGRRACLCPGSELNQRHADFQASWDWTKNTAVVGACCVRGGDSGRRCATYAENRPLQRLERLAHGAPFFRSAIVNRPTTLSGSSSTRRCTPPQHGLRVERRDVGRAKQPAVTILIVPIVLGSRHPAVPAWRRRASAAAAGPSRAVERARAAALHGQPLIVSSGHIRATRRAIAASSTVCTTGVMSL